MRELISTDPCTGAELWRGAIADAAAVDAAVARARAAQPHWEATPLDRRIAILRAYADRVKARAEDIARTISPSHTSRCATAYLPREYRGQSNANPCRTIHSPRSTPPTVQNATTRL
ncbi:MAG: aldehyde dehydrogenase family protein [Sphingomonadales bacterium]|nr:aldehyde dehydrogenase family protein [Sphingomonadales bacterium]